MKTEKNDYMKRQLKRPLQCYSIAIVQYGFFTYSKLGFTRLPNETVTKTIISSYVEWGMHISLGGW